MEGEKCIIVEMRKRGNKYPHKSWKMKFNEEFIIGRSPQCQVHIPHFTISRRHGKMKAVNEMYMMYEDMGTVNGSWVNNIRLGKPYLFDLTKLEELRLGECHYCLSFRISTVNTRDGMEQNDAINLDKENVVENEEKDEDMLRAICTNITEFPEDETKRAEFYQAKTPKALRSISILRRKMGRSGSKRRRSRSRSRRVKKGPRRVIRVSRSRSADKENRPEVL